MIVVDASVIAEVLQGRPLATERIASEWLCAPHLIDAEVMSFLRRHVRRGDITQAQAADALEAYHEIDIMRYEHLGLLERAWDLRHNLSSYDALYVALAEWQDVPLITTDGRIAGAPGTFATVEVLPLGA